MPFLSLPFFPSSSFPSLSFPLLPFPFLSFASEADAFFCFVEIMSEFRDHFCKQLDDAATGIKATMKRLSQCTAECDYELWDHLENRMKVSDLEAKEEREKGREREREKKRERGREREEERERKREGGREGADMHPIHQSTPSQSNSIVWIVQPADASPHLPSSLHSSWVCVRASLFACLCVRVCACVCVYVCGLRLVACMAFAFHI